MAKEMRLDRRQRAHLQGRLRTLRMTAGRFRTLLELPSTRMERQLRHSKLAEVEAECAYVERVIGFRLPALRYCRC
jgi:hypothetical protein